MPITKAGSERLRAELDHLKKVKRPEIIAAIAEARAHGDLKENAEYHAAREQQSFAEGRIKELESGLSLAQIIDVTNLKHGGKIVFGAKVTVADEETGDEMVYQIVGDLESDIEANLISLSSPLARALISKEEGDVVEFITPGGKRELEIVAVEY
jgi:transcription elongation factor GreA